jgi:hypothetical protein
LEWQKFRGHFFVVKQLGKLWKFKTNVVILIVVLKSLSKLD